MWKTLSSQWLMSLGGIELLLRCNYDDSVIKRDFVGKIPAFYVELLKHGIYSRLEETLAQMINKPLRFCGIIKKSHIIRTHYSLSTGLKQV